MRGIIRWIQLLFFKPKNINELAKECKTPKDIGLWMYLHIKYIGDKEKHNMADYWQVPERTFRDKSGDCDDFAVLAYEILKRNNIKSHILGVWGSRLEDDVYRMSAHAICAVKWQGSWYHVSNWGCKKSEAETLESLAFDIYPKTVFARKYTPDGKSLGVITREDV